MVRHLVVDISLNECVVLFSTRCVTRSDSLVRDFAEYVFLFRPVAYANLNDYVFKTLERSAVYNSLRYMQCFSLRQFPIMFKWFGERHMPGFFNIIALDGFLDAELNFRGHSRSSEMARLEREHTTSFIVMP